MQLLVEKGWYFVVQECWNFLMLKRVKTIVEKRNLLLDG